MTSFILAAAAASFAVLGALAPAHSQAKAEERMTEGSAIKVESLAKLDNPWAVKVMPDGRLLITEKPGHLRIYADGELSEPIKGVPKVEYHDQGGLLDVALDPDFAENRLVYLSFTEAAEKQPKVDSDKKDPRLGDYQDLDDTVLKGAAVARGRLDGETFERRDRDLAAGAEDDRPRPFRREARLRAGRQAVHHLGRPAALRAGAGHGRQSRQGGAHQSRRLDPGGQSVRRQGWRPRRYLDARSSQSARRRHQSGKRQALDP